MNPHRGSDFNEFLIEENLMTPTPRTDAAEILWTDAAEILWNDTGLCVVPADFARQLERELATERELAGRLTQTLANVQYDYASTGAITTQEVDESLAAWKEVRSGSV